MSSHSYTYVRVYHKKLAKNLNIHPNKQLSLNNALLKLNAKLLEGVKLYNLIQQTDRHIHTQKKTR